MIWIPISAKNSINRLTPNKMGLFNDVYEHAVVEKIDRSVIAAVM